MGPTNKYVRIAAVGQGGMADVWLVVAPGPAGFSKLLALKELKAELCSDPEFVAMFLAEARLAARLTHPNVVQTYEVGLDAQRPRLVMEWLEGQPMHALLAPGVRASLPLPVHVYVLAEVLAALEYAHDFRDYEGTPLNIVHRDVSPHNVFVCYDGAVKLMDFGIAKIAGTEGHTQAGVVKGKVGYVAPEQITGARVDRRADVFSVGVMLWEALVGRRLSAGEARNVIFAKRLQGVYEPVLRLVPDAPRELAAAVDRAMALSPDDRYPTAAAMRADLEAWLATNQRVSGREVSALMAGAFDAQRRHVRKLIEQQTRALREQGASEQHGLPVVALVPPGEGGTSSSGGRAGSVPSAARLPMSTVPALPPPPPEAGTSTQAMTQAMPAFAAPGAGRRRPGALRWAALGAAAAALGLGAFALGPFRRPEPAAAVAKAAAVEAAPSLPLGGPAVAPAAAAPAAEPADIELHVRTQPPGARVFLDGQPLGASPITQRVARDGEVHLLRVAANGFRDEERPIAFSRDYAVEVALRPQGRAAAKAAKAADEPAAAAPAPERLKQPARGTRPIEESNPY